MFKVNSKNTRMSSCRSGVFIVNFEHISHLFFSVSIVDLEQINVCWEATWGLRLDRIENNKKVWCNENALFPVLAPVKMKLYETNGNLFWKYQFLKFVKYKGTSYDILSRQIYRKLTSSLAVLFLFQETTTDEGNSYQ